MEEIDAYRTALQRIEKCIEERSTELDLSDLGLIQIPKEIRQCTQIEVLDLAANQISVIKNLEELILLRTLNIGAQTLKDKVKDGYKWHQFINRILRVEGLESMLQLRRLDLSRNQISKIQGLEKLEQLQQLDLSMNKISKIDILGNQKQLQQLNLSYNQISKIEGLQKLKQLKELDFSGNQISKIEGLEKVEQLQQLNLSRNQISRIEGLEKLEQLQQLNLSYNQISKIEELQKLKQLKELDFSGNQISKIEGLEKLEQLQQLNLYRNQISRIEGLEKLEQLQQLNLSRNQINKLEGLEKIEQLQQFNLSRNQISRLEGLEKLEQLQQLDFYLNQISKFEGLEKLEKLQHLNLSSNQISKMEGLEKLKQLQQLSLSNNQISKLEGLEKLEQLHQLHLSSNQISKLEGLEKLEKLHQLLLSLNQISKLEGLEKLEQLQQLHLSSNQISKMEGLEKLKQLQQLSLSNNQISKMEGLEKLEQLQQLDLSSNQIRKIEGLEKLEQLQQLSLYSNKISKIEGLEKLEELQKLNLTWNQITNIEGLEKLKQLQELQLYSNQINKIEGLEKLEQLHDLQLSSNQISKIEGLEKLEQLQQLDLSLNKISKIEGLEKQAQLQHFALSSNLITEALELQILLKIINEFHFLRILKLKGNPVIGIPEEIINGQMTLEGEMSCLIQLRAWFNDLEKGKQTNYQIKTMLIGNGAAGKTSLVEALKRGYCETTYTSTHGVLIEVLNLFTDDELQFYCWDFGGQEIYLGTHRLFLVSKGIHLIVIDPESENNSITTDRITGEVHRNLKAESWLRLSEETSPKSKRIIVQNKMDQFDRLKQIESLAVNNEIPFIHISAIKGTNIDDLQFRLKKVAHELPEYNMQMPKSWFLVREYFLKNLIEKNPVRTISKKHFDERCRKEGVAERSIPSVLNYLHDTGIIYYNEHYLRDTIIADQRWALNIIYKVLERGSRFYDFMKNEAGGKCRVKYLFAEIGEEYSNELKELILEFMTSCGLCFIVGEDRNQKLTPHSWCVFPEFLSEEISSTAKVHWNSKQERVSYLRKHHPFLHYYTVQQFISFLSTKTDLSLIWKNGIVVNAANGSFKVEGDFDDNTIHISIDKSASPEWIREIIYNIEGGDEKNLSGWQISYDGKQFIEINWEQFTIGEQITIGRQKGTSKKELLESLPNVIQRKPKELIFSYAKEDLDTLLLIRKHLGGPVHDNLISIWYDKDLSNTRNWDVEIKQHFESCDAVIIIGSSDYNSPDKAYIWQQEIPIITSRFDRQELFAIRINASSFVPSRKINAINCFAKEKSIPTTRTKKNDFIMKFVRDEIMNKLLKKS